MRGADTPARVFVRRLPRVWGLSAYRMIKSRMSAALRARRDVRGNSTPRNRRQPRASACTTAKVGRFRAQSARIRRKSAATRSVRLQPSRVPAGGPLITGKRTNYAPTRPRDGGARPRFDARYAPSFGFLRPRNLIYRASYTSRRPRSGRPLDRPRVYRICPGNEDRMRK